MSANEPVVKPPEAVAADAGTVLTRDERQKHMLPNALLSQQIAMVVGVGAIGRHVTTMLAAMGIGSLVLVDPDVVSVENLSSQGWRPADLDLHKVDALAIEVAAMNPAVRVSTRAGRFQRPQSLPVSVVFSCVDDMEARRFVAECCKEHWTSEDERHLFVDCRMAAEILRVLSVSQPSEWPRYEGTLFSQAEAYGGTCTRQTTIYCANICAGKAVAEFAKWLRRVPTEPDQMENLLCHEAWDPKPEAEPEAAPEAEVADASKAA